MEIPTVHGEPREASGRHANARLRRRGLVPAIVYGHKEAPVTVAVSVHDLKVAVGHLRHVIQVDVAGQAAQYLVKDVQYDHLQKEPVHVDLRRVAAGDRVHVKVGLVLKGDPKGVHEGGELIHLLTDLELECPLAEIPEVLYHNIKDLDLGQALHIKDLELPPNVKPMHNPDDIIALVRVKRGEEGEAVVEAAPAAATTAEPEVIGKGPKEAEGEGGE